MASVITLALSQSVELTSVLISLSTLLLTFPVPPPEPVPPGPLTAVFAGGPLARASYEEVSTRQTGHAEAVEVTYDPAVISSGTLLKVFFLGGHWAPPVPQ